jgi:hypothetical protein
MLKTMAFATSTSTSQSPQLNGKVDGSHRTHQEEFYQLLTFTDDVGLSKKLRACEDLYNLNRSHGAHDGGTPYVALTGLIAQPAGVQVD